MGRPRRKSGTNPNLAGGDTLADNGGAGVIDGVSGNSDDTNGVEQFPEFGTASDTGGGTEPGDKPRRGRPKGSGTQRAGLPDLETLTDAVHAVHDICDSLIGTHIDLDKDEAAKLAKALIRLQKHYPNVDVPAKALAWGELMIACQQVYGTRIAAAFLERKNKQKGGPVAVIPQQVRAQSN